MSDYYEIDFLDVESEKSGDAIAVRYQVNGVTHLHVVDGGFQATGDSLANHIRKYYGGATYIDRVVVTHPDGDHAGGLRTILEEFEVGELWMLRPWEYADILIDRFARFKSVENLQERLRDIYPNIAALEEIAIDRGIPMFAPFQGSSIGAFLVLAPSVGRYLDLIVASEKTPEAARALAEAEARKRLGFIGSLAVRAISAIRAAWGEEAFSPEETSAENDMSIVQYATLCEKRILLTGDAGRSALTEAADFAEEEGIPLPGVDRFQVPHHGSRRNVSTDVLDRWLGARRDSSQQSDPPTFDAVISSAKLDEDHPRKAVIRAMIHRGGRVTSTEGRSIRLGENAPVRAGWTAATPMSYPTEQEE